VGIRARYQFHPDIDGARSLWFIQGMTKKNVGWPMGQNEENEFPPAPCPPVQNP